MMGIPMKPFNLAAMLFAVLFFAGCAVAPQNPVALQSNFWDATPKKVGIVMTKVPSLQMTYPGAGCFHRCRCQVQWQLRNEYKHDIIKKSFKIC